MTTQLQSLIEKREDRIKSLTDDLQALDPEETDHVDVEVHEDALSREKGFLADLRALLPKEGSNAKDLPPHIMCKGSMALGSGCGRCARCREWKNK